MSLINKSIGDNFPNIINAIIEIEKDSSAKYQLVTDSFLKQLVMMAILLIF